MASPSEGANRQRRRMQLRNAGFRAPAIPGRKTTPVAVTFTPSDPTEGYEDQENLPSPCPERNVSGSESKRRKGSGVLQEINNGSLSRQPKRTTRARITSAKFTAPRLGEQSSEYDVAFRAEMSSPPPPKSSTFRPRSLKLRSKIGPKRRSVSGETRKYVEALEDKLAEAESQLSAVTSPTVTREQSSKLRTLTTESKQLQAQLDEQEKQFEERLREMEDHRKSVEHKLQNTEYEAEEAKYRVHELEEQLHHMTENLEAADAANIQLEKRLEIMSELLAMSPTKIDLHAETPGQRQRRRRPQSCTDAMLGGGETVASAIARFDMPPPDMAAMSGRSRPMRRMRRFGAGSVGPKPLILPSTSHCDLLPASAPGIERRDSPYFASERDAVTEDEGSPVPITRRRASTTADALTLANLACTPFLEVPRPDEDQESSLPSRPVSATPQCTPRNLSSWGSSVGRSVSRNLMEELALIQAENAFKESEPEEVTETEEQWEDITVPEDAVPQEDGSDDSTPQPTERAEEEESTQLVHSRAASSMAMTGSTTTAVQSRSRASSIIISSAPSTNTTTTPASLFARLRALFGDIWRSPFELARHLMQTAQSRMRIPSSLQNTQIWLLSILLGPMARRQLLCTRKRRDSDSRSSTPTGAQKLLLPTCSSASSSVQTETDDSIAYGTIYSSPPGSPSHTIIEEVFRERRKAGTGMAGFGKKRAGRSSSQEDDRRECLRKGFYKHSPWLWIGFSITLACAIGAAFTSGPGALMKGARCGCEECRKTRKQKRIES